MINHFCLIMIVWMAFLHEAAATTEGGRETGNGGGAIVCRGDGRSPVLLDLWAAEQAGAVITRSTEPRANQLEAAIQKLEVSAPELAESMRDLHRGFQEVPIGGSGYRLPPPNDTKIRFLELERECSLEGVARAIDASDELQVDYLIFNAMSPTDQAALYFHEALYKAQRKGPTKVNDSVIARKVTGAVFSDAPLPFTSPASAREFADYECDAEGRFHFFLSNLATGHVSIQFTRIEGYNLIDKVEYTTNYDLSRDLPRDHPSSLKSLVKHMSTGFAHTKLQSDRQSWNAGDSSNIGYFETKSEYEPPYTISIYRGDSTVYCNSWNLEQESGEDCQEQHFAWRRPNQFQNTVVRIWMTDERQGKLSSAKVSCKQL